MPALSQPNASPKNDLEMQTPKVTQVGIGQSFWGRAHPCRGPAWGGVHPPENLGQRLLVLVSQEEKGQRPMSVSEII